MSETSEQVLAEAVGEKLAEIDRKLMTLLGMSVTYMAPGFATVKMPVRDDMVNSHGYCQGGLLFALADHAFAYACMSQNKAGVTLSANIIFNKPAKLGDLLTATATVSVDGGRVATCAVSVTNQHDLILAQFQGVNYRTKAAVIDQSDGAGD